LCFAQLNFPNPPGMQRLTGGLPTRHEYKQKAGGLAAKPPAAA